MASKCPRCLGGYFLPNRDIYGGYVSCILCSYEPTDGHTPPPLYTVPGERSARRMRRITEAQMIARTLAGKHRRAVLREQERTLHERPA